MNRRARDRVSDTASAARSSLLNEAMLLTYAGRPLDALAVLEPVPPTRRAPRARALRALAEVPALVATGRCATAAEAAGRAFAEQTELPDQIAIPGPGVHVLTRIYALAECGRLRGGRRAGHARPTRPPRRRRRPTRSCGSATSSAGARCSRSRSRRRGAGSGRRPARCEPNNIVGPRRLVLSRSPPPTACLGDAAAAAATVLELDRRPPFPFTRPEQELGRAWALVGGGRPPRRPRTCCWRPPSRRRPAATARTEAWLLHDVARLGDPASVADRLD